MNHKPSFIFYRFLLIWEYFYPTFAAMIFPIAMKTNIYLLLCFCLFLTVSCEDEVEPGFSLEAIGDIVIDSDIDSQGTVSFTSTREWTAKTDADWVSISPVSGSAGTSEITVTARSENATGDVRTATLTLTSGKLSKDITLQQFPADYVKVEQNSYNVALEGEELKISFITNVPKNELKIYYTDSDWLTQPAQTRSDSYSINFTVLPNTSESPRTARIMFIKETDAERLVLATVTVTQLGSPVRESTDYSKDKTVRILQTASEGNGIPIVIMGDGFNDAEIADGTYDKVMDKALENLFTEEPAKSLRDYFNVYAVTAVSKNNIFGNGYETAFSCWLEGGSSTLIEGDDEAVQKYMQCVSGIDYTKTLVIVILNSSEHAGTTYFGYTSGSKRIEFAIAYCPVIKNLESEDFRQVLIHEAVGHGFAKLEDEYYYTGTIPLDKEKQVKELQQIGWAQNVDFTKDRTEVLWTQFLNDNRYTSEGLGIFEGACTYRYGAYRPSEDSMMNSNTTGFNAPSRKAIYDRIMKEGGGVEPTYEQFAFFDLQTVSPLRLATRTAVTPGTPFAHPRLVDKALTESISK